MPEKTPEEPKYKAIAWLLSLPPYKMLIAALFIGLAYQTSMKEFDGYQASKALKNCNEEKQRIVSEANRQTIDILIKANEVQSKVNKSADSLIKLSK